METRLIVTHFIKMASAVYYVLLIIIPNIMKPNAMQNASHKTNKFIKGIYQIELGKINKT